MTEEPPRASVTTPTASTASARLDDGKTVAGRR